MNSNSSLRSSVIQATLLTALLGVIGCHDTGPKNTEFFVQDEARAVSTTIERQTANGARHDAMLWEQHFDGGRLNALGRRKLDLMLSQPGPVTVYLPGSVEKDVLDARRQAIVAYAKDSGRGESDLKTVDGINPATLHLAAPDLARLNKTELGKAEGSTAADTTTNSEGFGASGNNSPGAMGSTAKTGG